MGLNFVLRAKHEMRERLSEGPLWTALHLAISGFVCFELRVWRTNKDLFFDISHHKFVQWSLEVISAVHHNSSTRQMYFHDTAICSI
jgi:hypothetical protein